MALALDEPNEENDDVIKEENLTFVVEKKLMSEAAPINIDVSYMGFQVTSSLPLGGGCGSSCDSGSCSC